LSQHFKLHLLQDNTDPTSKLSANSHPSYHLLSHPRCMCILFVNVIYKKWEFSYPENRGGIIPQKHHNKPLLYGVRAQKTTTM